LAGFVWPEQNERRRIASGTSAGESGVYDRTVFVCEAGGDALRPSVLGAPKIRTPTPVSNNKVSSATETTAKL
jgi:hypothetical protein